MAEVSLGAYVGSVEPEINYIDEFKKNEKEKTPNVYFDYVKKIAVEAPAGTELTINNTDLKMPSTGVLEFGLGLIEIRSLIFKSAVEVNIVYMY